MMRAGDHRGKRIGRVHEGRFCRGSDVRSDQQTFATTCPRGRPDRQLGGYSGISTPPAFIWSTSDCMSKLSLICLIRSLRPARHLKDRSSHAALHRNLPCRGHGHRPTPVGRMVGTSSHVRRIHQFQEDGFGGIAMIHPSGVTVNVLSHSTNRPRVNRCRDDRSPPRPTRHAADLEVTRRLPS